MLTEMLKLLYRYFHEPFLKKPYIILFSFCCHLQLAVFIYFSQGEKAHGVVKNSNIKHKLKQMLYTTFIQP